MKFGLDLSNFGSSSKAKCYLLLVFNEFIFFVPNISVVSLNCVLSNSK
jgi:hypothetical protein